MSGREERHPVEESRLDMEVTLHEVSLENIKRGSGGG
jgi:hypothetical protein